MFRHHGAIRRLRQALTTTVVIVLVEVLVLSTSASAHHDGYPALGTEACPHGGNYESVACLLYTGEEDGAYAYWNNNTMYIDPSFEAAGQHINHTMWMYSNSPCNPFVELGYTHGFYGMTGYRYYQGYWNGVGNPVAYPYNATSNNGTTHSYWIRYDGSRQFTLLLDGVPIPGAVYGASQNQGYGGCRSAVGLEVSQTTTPPDGHYWTQTFDIQGMIWKQPNGNWLNWPSSYSYIYYPCGSYAPPQCFNGTYYPPNPNGHWADNKPQF